MLFGVRNLFRKKVLGQRFDLGHGTERQIATNLWGIRADHKSRYRFASSKLLGVNILDAACGIGYGSFILAKGNNRRKIWAVDKNEPAHYFGKAHYEHKNILRIPLFLEDISKLDKKFDGCTCFETLEHLNDPVIFLKELHALMKPGGKLFASSPNELVMPFQSDKFRHHIQHFTPSGFDELFEQSGWKVISRNSQKDKYANSISDHVDGAYLVWECEA